MITPIHISKLREIGVILNKDCATIDLIRILPETISVDKEIHKLDIRYENKCFIAGYISNDGSIFDMVSSDIDNCIISLILEINENGYRHLLNKPKQRKWYYELKLNDDNFKNSLKNISVLYLSLSNAYERSSSNEIKLPVSDKLKFHLDHCTLLHSCEEQYGPERQYELKSYLNFMIDNFNCIVPIVITHIGIHRTDDGCVCAFKCRIGNIDNTAFLKTLHITACTIGDANPVDSNLITDDEWSEIHEMRTECFINKVEL